RSLHPFHRSLDTPRGNDRARRTLGIDQSSDAARHPARADAGYVSVGLRSTFAHTDGRRLPGHPEVADLDVVTAGGQLSTRLIAECNVPSTCRIVIKSEHAQGRIVVASGVLVKRDFAVRRVLGSAQIAVESLVTLGRIIAGASVVVQGIGAVGR